MTSPGNDSYLVGEWLVDPAGDLLSRDGVDVRIEPRTMAVLHFMAQRPGEVVSAEDLIAEVWQGRPMGDNPVYKCIADLRKALGDNPKAPTYIENIPKKGYRLIAAVRPAGLVSAPTARVERPAHRLPAMQASALLLGALLVVAAAWRLAVRPPGPPPEAPVDHPVIAVLPFSDLSPGQDQGYFADGMAEELLNALAKAPTLRVIARSSSFAFRDPGQDIASVAEKLQATHVLEGSVRKSGDRVRVTVQLIDASNHLHLWSDTYDASLGDILNVQYEIATRISRELLPRLKNPFESVSPPRNSPAAAIYEHYFKGRYYLQQFQEDSVRQAKEQFERALDIDPGFALAWAGLADAYKTLDYFAVLTPDEAARRGRAAAERALAFDPGLAEAHAALGTVLADYFFEWESAERHFRQAIERNPSYATGFQLYAEYLRDMGRFDEALAMIEQAQLLDPLSTFNRLVEGIILDLSRRHREAIDRYEALLELHPGYRMTHFYLGLAKVHLERYESALASFEAADPDGNLPDAVATRAMTLIALGRTDEAEDILAELQQLSETRYVSPFLLALVRIAQGDRERALDLLEQTYAERSWFVRLFGIVPGLDPLRGEPRFQALLRQAGLAKVAAASPSE